MNSLCIVQIAAADFGKADVENAENADDGDDATPSNEATEVPQDFNTVIHNVGGHPTAAVLGEDCNTDDDINALEDAIESSACSTPTFRVSSAHEQPPHKKVVS